MARKPASSSRQIPLPSIPVETPDDIQRVRGPDPINHHEILRTLQSSGGYERGIVEIYRREVLPVRTRTIHLLGRKCRAEVLHTLLGFEVKASYKRIHCPDMVTARYVKLFSELGCRTIKLPYDPTVTASIVSELDASLALLLAGIRQRFSEHRPQQLYVIRSIYTLIRQDLRRT